MDATRVLVRRREGGQLRSWGGVLSFTAPAIGPVLSQAQDPIHGQKRKRLKGMNGDVAVGQEHTKPRHARSWKMCDTSLCIEGILH